MSRTAIAAPTDDTADTTLGRFTDVQERAPSWLWPGWLPLGKLAILDGDPGLGKSTLMFDLAARVSKDGIMPDGSQGATGSVIIANAEDDLHDTIKPRLLAAGANAERGHWTGPARTSFGRCSDVAARRSRARRRSAPTPASVCERPNGRPTSSGWF